MGDDQLINLLDIKFQIAQESNLLTKRFKMPPRPASLAAYELHIPLDEFHVYATEWLAELEVNLERHKNLDIYNLSDVFIQSLEEYKTIYDYSKVLSKLSVEDLIASCSEYLEEQVLNESKSATARKQHLAGKADTVPDAKPPKTEFPKLDLTSGRGALTMKQAKAFFTEMTKAMGGGDKKITLPIAVSSDFPRFLIVHVRHPTTDVQCQACGKWYKSNPGRTFPYPCHGTCQYTGHPSLNKKYQEGVKWKYTGYCCSWKGIEDKDIPAHILTRLQKYASERKERESS